MDKKDHRPSSLLSPNRRQAVILTGAVLGVMVAHPALSTLVATPAQTAGPFYPLTKLDDSDGDLTQVVGRSKRASGQVIDIVGRVFDARGHRLARAWVEIWQADAFGIYHHPYDPGNSNADPNFQGFAMVRTSQDGDYRFRTIKPKSYNTGSIKRTPHIHFRITEGSSVRLITQMYFPNEQLNKTDALFGRLSGAIGRSAATARLIKAGPPLQYQYDIVV